MNTPAVTNLLGVRVREKHDVGPGREGVIMAVQFGFVTNRAGQVSSMTYHLLLLGDDQRLFTIAADEALVLE